MRIKKTSETRALAGNIVNAYSESQNSTYSCDYLNKCNNYSGTEVNTGKKWVDGKDIYRRTVFYDFNATSSSGSFSKDVSSFNIDTITLLNPIVFKGVGTGNLMKYTGNFYLGSDNASFAFFRNNLLEFRLYVASDTLFNIYVELEYTKTTD